MPLIWLGDPSCPDLVPWARFSRRSASLPICPDRPAQAGLGSAWRRGWRGRGGGQGRGQLGGTSSGFGWVVCGLLSTLPPSLTPSARPGAEADLLSGRCLSVCCIALSVCYKTGSGADASEEGKSRPCRRVLAPVRRAACPPLPACGEVGLRRPLQLGLEGVLVQGGHGTWPWGLCPPALDVQQRPPRLPCLPSAGSGHVLLPDETPRLRAAGAAGLECLPGPPAGRGPGEPAGRSVRWPESVSALSFRRNRGGDGEPGDGRPA